MMAATRKTLLLGLIAGVFVPMTVLGQQGYPVQALGIFDISGDITITGEQRDRESLYASSNSETREEETYFTEQLDLNLDGYFYHPNMMEWDASFRVGLQQQRINIDDEVFSTDGRISGYNLSGFILREKPLTLRAFSSESRDFLDRDFAQRIEFQNKRQGAELLVKGPFPLSLLGERIELHETSDIRENDQKTKKLRFFISDERDRDWSTKFEYERELTDETSIFHPPGSTTSIVRDLPDKRDEVNVTNLWRFGETEEKSRLSGGVRAMDRRGFYNNKIFTAEQRMNVVHTDTFSTFYQALWSEDETDSDMNRTANGELGFTKRIYDSLDITGRTSRTSRMFGDGGEDITSVSLDMQYRKKTPVGRVTSSLLVGRDFREEESETGTRNIRDEAITLTGTTFRRLSEPGVVAGSVVVTNLAGTVTYVLGLDYVLRTRGAYTEIARVLAGGILDGETVLVDYVITVSPFAELTTDHIRWSNRLDLEDLPLAFYFEYAVLDEDLQSGDDPGNLEQEITRLLGVELDCKGLTISVEREMRDQQLSAPFTEDRVRLRYRRRIGRGVDLSLGARVSRLEYHNGLDFGLQPGRDLQKARGADASLVVKLRRNTLLRLSGDYYRTQGRDNDERGQIRLAFEYTFRDIDLAIGARHDVLRQEADTRTAQQITFDLHRRF